MGRLYFYRTNGIVCYPEPLWKSSLSYTISLTATIALSQIIAFSALLRIIMEIILLQIYTSRVKRGITKLFDYKSVTKNLKLPFIILLSYMWFAIVTANLNIWGYIYSKFNMLIDYPNKIGSITFTLGNILLFFNAHMDCSFIAKVRCLLFWRNR
jgi:potassium efflux system protein